MASPEIVRWVGKISEARDAAERERICEQIFSEGYRRGFVIGSRAADGAAARATALGLRFNQT